MDSDTHVTESKETVVEKKTVVHEPTVVEHVVHEKKPETTIIETTHTES